MADALGRVDTHVVAAAAGDDDVANDVLQIEGAVPPETQCAGERFRGFRPAVHLALLRRAGFRLAALPLRCLDARSCLLLQRPLRPECKRDS